ncbi:hypothetical protein [Beggiatoa leptomitoformis]|uniref:Uncharacterized protein n=1 Tax=Beggiatoa leptomitoformis TaxID=288004 RepID=A0A650GDQ8_9GAMM|nr:hypothetical protein [Beggiatoa leptomitoformis]QGX03493.1 hypothetical protein AL038_18345 [Beggiatoa leptomitoformis]QGX04032.1 hypothetical protein BLE401_18415 [Beggiatoa leptomitoformis]
MTQPDNCLWCDKELPEQLEVDSDGFEICPFCGGTCSLSLQDDDDDLETAEY